MRYEKPIAFLCALLFFFAVYPRGDIAVSVPSPAPLEVEAGVYAWAWVRHEYFSHILTA